MLSTLRIDSDTKHSDCHTNCHADCPADCQADRHSHSHQHLHTLSDPISKVNNYFYFGSSRHSQEMTDEFTNLKIDVVIDCVGQLEIQPNFNFEVMKFSFEDGINATLLEEIDLIDSTIYTTLGSKKKIYLQCPTGNSISPAIIIYYLMCHKNLNFDNALEALQKIRPTINLNSYFINELQNIDEWCTV
jgi:protein-tyrosine phosphatase